MTRTIRTLLVSAAALGSLATAAIAAPTAPLSHGLASGLPGMHGGGGLHADDHHSTSTR